MIWLRAQSALIDISRKAGAALLGRIVEHHPLAGFEKVVQSWPAK